MAGPYRVLKRVGAVNYQAYNRRNRKRIFCVVERWYILNGNGYLAQESKDTELEDVPVRSEGSYSEAKRWYLFGEQL